MVWPGYSLLQHCMLCYSMLCYGIEWYSGKSSIIKPVPGGETPSKQPVSNCFWYSMVWFGVVWHGTVWFGWYGTVWQGLDWFDAFKSGCYQQI